MIHSTPRINLYAEEENTETVVFTISTFRWTSIDADPKRVLLPFTNRFHIRS